MGDPYKIDGPALIAVSGGRTSGFMLRQILDAHDGELPKDVIPTFCNTALEHTLTLDFVDAMERYWKVPIVWLEYRYHAPAEAERLGLKMVRETEGRQPGVHWFEIVTHATASRNGEPFTQLIEQRQFLPNPVTRFCTVELKIRTMARYARSLGWGHHTKAIGLRYDESRRVAGLSNNAGGEEAVCPMHAARHTIDDVERFWAAQPFRLEIPQHQGNCQGCFLKSRYRLEQVARETPEAFDWWIAQEEKARDWAADGVAKSFRFRNDRASYRVQLEMAKQPTLFDGCEVDDTMPCTCTD